VRKVVAAAALVWAGAAVLLAQAPASRPVQPGATAATPAAPQRPASAAASNAADVASHRAWLKQY
jgi:hypothetical protein